MSEKSHDQLVEKLEGILRSSGQYYSVLTHVLYGTQSKIIGEIDVLALGYNIFDLYEVKGSEEQSSLRKAVSQVLTARLYFGQQGREFIYTPQNGIEPLDVVKQKLHGKKRNKKRKI